MHIVFVCVIVCVCVLVCVIVCVCVVLFRQPRFSQSRFMAGTQEPWDTSEGSERKKRKEENVFQRERDRDRSFFVLQTVN